MIVSYEHPRLYQPICVDGGVTKNTGCSPPLRINLHLAFVSGFIICTASFGAIPEIVVALGTKKTRF